LGFQVTVSPPTNQEILELGLASCVDGACLPIKAFLGHIQFLVRQGLSLLFVPRLVSLFREEYTCPNLLGLPDLVRSYVPSGVQLLSVEVDARRGRAHLPCTYLRWGLEFADLPTVIQAYRRAQWAQRKVNTTHWRYGSLPRPSVLLVGPRYLLDDPYLTANIQEKLEQLGVQVSTASQLPDRVTVKASRFLEKRPFWTATRRSMGSLQYWRHHIDGVISLAPFGCGAEAMQGVLLAQHLKGRDLPYLELYLDEHSSPVGLLTRLEAFCDLLERKRSG